MQSGDWRNTAMLYQAIGPICSRTFFPWTYYRSVGCPASLARWLSWKQLHQLTWIWPVWDMLARFFHLKNILQLVFGVIVCSVTIFHPVFFPSNHALRTTWKLGIKNSASWSALDSWCPQFRASSCCHLSIHPARGGKKKKQVCKTNGSGVVSESMFMFLALHTTHLSPGPRVATPNTV